MYFAGYVSMSIIVGRLGDILGRKWPATVCAIFSVPVHGMLFFSTNLNLTIVLFFMTGALGPGKC
jgi:MFS family permease